MKCATNVSIVLAFFAAAALLVTSSAAGRLSTHSALDPSEYPLITEADMQSGRKWRAAILSTDPTTLDHMLELCKGHEERYAREMCNYAWEAQLEEQWESFSKIIKAMCMDPDRFKGEIVYNVRNAMIFRHDAYLAAIVDGITEKMDQIPDITYRVLAELIVVGQKHYPESAKRIHENVTHAGLKEFSEIAMTESKDERLDALVAFLKRTKDLPEGIIEAVAQLMLNEDEYHPLKALLEMKPRNTDYIRGWLAFQILSDVLRAKFDQANELIRIFDISAAEVHNPLKETIRKCIEHGLTENLDSIFKFLNNAAKARNAPWNIVGSMDSVLPAILDNILHFLENKPQGYKLAVNVALEEFTQERIAEFDATQGRLYKICQDWVTNEESRQKEEDIRVREACFLNGPVRSNHKSESDMIQQWAAA